MADAILVRDLGIMPYRPAWTIQEQVLEQVAAGGQQTLLLVEHPPVITTGRRPQGLQNLLASRQQLAQMSVDLVESDRGGDITFHGPGQIVAYPIIRLADHQLTISGYVHRLEQIVIAALADIAIPAHAEPSAVGIWTDQTPPAKICAIGVRIRRGVTMHGLALNVQTDLRYFDLINPCGLSRPVTSVKNILGPAAPDMEAMEKILAARLLGGFAPRESSSSPGTPGED